MNKGWVSSEIRALSVPRIFDLGEGNIMRAPSAAGSGVSVSSEERDRSWVGVDSEAGVQPEKLATQMAIAKISPALEKCWTNFRHNLRTGLGDGPLRINSLSLTRVKVSFSQ
jgi:hypothetical protein